MTAQNKTDTNLNNVNLCTQRINALTKYVSATTAVKIEGVTGTVDDVVALYQACLDTRTVLATAQTQVQVALADRDDADAKRRSIDEGLLSWVVTEFGGKSEAARAFGIVPKKRAKPSTETLMNAQAQANATRQARNTMGKRAKQKIHGVVAAASTSAPTAPRPATAAPIATPGSAPLAATSGH